MRILRHSPVLLAVFVLGCVAISVDSEYLGNADFSKYKTYAWKEGLQEQPDDPRIDNTLLDTHIKIAVRRRFAELGYKETDQGEPDFYVGYHAAVARRVESSKPSDYYGAIGEKGYLGGYRSRYGAYGEDWGRVSVPIPAYEYDMGTLVLDIIEAESGSLVWRGWARAEIDLWVPGGGGGERIDEAVTKILANFPPV
ncbi:MAG: DUF4136 domain-containing protein [Myxococcota bacterium]